jgi:hypothetical protein
MNKGQWVVFIIGVLTLFFYGIFTLNYSYNSPFWIRIAPNENNLDGIKLYGHMFYFWLFFVIGFFSALFWAARTKNNQ